ncbi:transposase [Brasilonema sp. CT11]|nr:transposase [Brasilonema sp. CT11]
MMNWQAENAQRLFAQTGQITVIVQDRGNVHTCKEVREYFPIWESSGLYIFFLPSYCSQMNLIESEWQQLKEDEIAGRMFEDEYDLAIAVIRGIDCRAYKASYHAQRFHFENTEQETSSKQSIRAIVIPLLIFLYTTLFIFFYLLSIKIKLNNTFISIFTGL